MTSTTKFQGRPEITLQNITVHIRFPEDPAEDVCRMLKGRGYRFNGETWRRKMHVMDLTDLHEMLPEAYLNMRGIRLPVAWDGDKKRR